GMAIVRRRFLRASRRACDPIRSDRRGGAGQRSGSGCCCLQKLTAVLFRFRHEYETFHKCGGESWKLHVAKLFLCSERWPITDRRYFPPRPRGSEETLAAKHSEFNLPRRRLQR